MQEKPTVVIAGAGLSGTLVAIQLLQHFQAGARVVLVDRSPETFAKGVAYRTECFEHLLNVPAAKMSAFPDKPEDFLQWLNSNGYDYRDIDFVPRKTYGDYIQARLQEAIAQRRPDVDYERVIGEVLHIELDETRSEALVHIASHDPVRADFVVFAVGNYPAAIPSSPKSLFYQSNRFIRNVWLPNSTAAISPEAPILIIGTGLTMVDKVLELTESDNHTGPIYAISRRGLVPQVHQFGTQPIKLDITAENSRSIDTLFHYLRDLTKTPGQDWRSVIDGLRPHTQGIWKALPLAEKRRFLRYMSPFWDTHRHRMAPEIGEKIAALQVSGQLQLIRGRLLQFDETPDGVVVSYRRRFQPECETLKVAYVLNCSGSDANFKDRSDPLIINLLEQGAIVPNSLGMGLEVDDNGALINQLGHPSSVVFTLGPPLKGKLYETTAAPEIRVQAQNLASLIANKLTQSPAIS